MRFVECVCVFFSSSSSSNRSVLANICLLHRLRSLSLSLSICLLHSLTENVPCSLWVEGPMCNFLMESAYYYYSPFQVNHISIQSHFSLLICLFFGVALDVSLKLCMYIYVYLMLFFFIFWSYVFLYFGLLFILNNMNYSENLSIFRSFGCALSLSLSKIKQWVCMAKLKRTKFQS